MEEKSLVTVDTTEFFRQNVLSVLVAVPESYLLFVGAQTCVHHNIYRFIDEMKGKFSVFSPEGVSIALGFYLDEIVNAAKELYEKIGFRCLFVVVSCQLDLIGADLELICEEIESELHIPVRAISVSRLRLDLPTGEYFCDSGKNHDKTGTNPLKIAYDFLQPQDKNALKSVNIIGDVKALSPSSDLIEVMKKGEVKVFSLATADSFSAYQQMATAWLNIITNKQFLDIGIELEKRLGIPYLPLCGKFSLRGISEEYREICGFLDIPFEPTLYETKICTKVREIKSALAGKGLEIKVSEDNTLEMPSALLDLGLPVERILLQPAFPKFPRRGRNQFDKVSPREFKENKPIEGEEEFLACWGAVEIVREEPRWLPPLNDGEVRTPMLPRQLFGKPKQYSEAGFECLSSLLDKINSSVKGQGGE